jgi:nicotinamidase-related amidase
MCKDTALMIIDVQVAPFIWHQYGGKDLYNSEQFLSNISLLIEKARKTNTPIIYVQYTEGDDSQVWRKGSPLWEIHPQVKPKEDDIVIIKYHADPFYDTGLHEILCSIGIKKLVIAGLQTEFCVDTTCRCAYSLGYKNVLVSDGHTTCAQPGIMTPSQTIEHHNTVIESQFAELKKTQEVEF